MKYMLSLALFITATSAMAETVPSTFDPGCYVNYINGGCGERMIGNGPASAKEVVVTRPQPEPQPEPCDYKEKKV